MSLFCRHYRLRSWYISGHRSCSSSNSRLTSVSLNRSLKVRMLFHQKPEDGVFCVEKSQTREKYDISKEEGGRYIYLIERLRWIKQKYTHNNGTFLLNNILNTKSTNRETKFFAMCPSCFYCTHRHIQVAEFTLRYTNIDFYTRSCVP